MKNTITVVLISLILLSNISFADVVSEEQAKQSAKNIYFNRVNLQKSVELKDINLTLVYTAYNNTTPLYYAYNVDGNNGFVIISASDATLPLIGYSFERGFDLSNSSEEFKLFMGEYAEQIEYVEENNIAADSRISNSWQESYSPVLSTKGVNATAGPLLLTTWNQDDPYNEACPVDAQGPGGRVYVGCVALAMAQVMKYYNYPAQGEGSRTSYVNFNGGYPTTTVNFATQTYEWSNMPLSMTSSNSYLTDFLFDCSVAVDMNYGPDGSGSNSPKIVTALETYFKYDTQCEIIDRSSYTDAAWITIVKAEIDNNRPTVYTGMGTTVGHAWNCDGYNNDELHMNWGWGGSSNGYFNINNFTSTGYVLALDHTLVRYIYPEANYPEGCSATPKLITGSQGTFDDGSGNTNYVDNADCQYLIQPECGSSMELAFDTWNVDAGDVVYIYDGSTTSDPLLATFDGANSTSVVTSSGNSLLVNFVSNSSTNNTGWDASYKTLTCGGIKTITDNIGTVEDGSADCDYEAQKICKWYLEPTTTNNTFELEFTEFELDGGSNDFVAIYKDNFDSNNEIGVYNATNIPSTLSIYGDKIIVYFKTDYSGSAAGWKFNYDINTDIDENSIVESISIYPNPFNTDATINYNLIQNGNVSIDVVNILGTKVGQIQVDNQISGSHKINLSEISGELNNGIYFINIRVNNTEFNYKVVKTN